MSVAVNIPPFFQHITDGVTTTDVKGNTVGECLQALIKRFPHLEAMLFDEKGKLYSYLDVFVNRKSAHPEELAKKVADGDELHIINIILGG